MGNENGVNYPYHPQRAERAAAEAAVKGVSDAAAAWKILADQAILPPGVFGHPQWTFLEELFEKCSSCGGSALDTDSGACYACNWNGYDLVGHRSTPYPPTMTHVIAYAADASNLLRVEASAQTLAERLVPWGTSAAMPPVEWVVEKENHLGREISFVVAFIRPVLAALSDALADPSLALSGVAPEWVELGNQGWERAREKGIELFCTRLNPFEPVDAILRAGYWAKPKDAAIRISCNSL